MAKAPSSDTDIALALQTLRAVCLDETNTAASRSSAGRTILEYYGYLGTGRTQVPDLSSKSHTELSLVELRRRAAELRSNGAGGTSNPPPGDDESPF
jgi:hypothetical protein